MKLIVSGGGTGGHIFAGISILQEFKKCYPDGEILFIGAKDSLEERLVPKEGIPLKTLDLGSLKGVSLKKKLITLFKLPFSLISAAKIIIEFKPNAVIGVGGYASGPSVLMAKMLSSFFKIQTALLEQNAVSGFTNRLLSKKVDLIFCAFPGIENQFPGKKVILSGNPIRSVFQKCSPKTPSDSLCIFIFGGSQGAVGINTLVLESLPFLKDLSIKFIHQTGEKDCDRVKNGYEAVGINARVEKFIYDMKDCYEAANLIICRAGSSTLSEIAATGRPSFLIPYPFASDNHQEKNGRLFEEKKAARVFLQGKISPKEFADEIRKLMTDFPLQNEMSQNLNAFHHKNPANLIVKTLLSQLS